MLLGALDAMGVDVFISYAIADKLTADAACAALESASIRCWIAPRDVLPGMDYAEAIIEALEKCRGMLLIFSSNANRSNQVKREVERAVHHGIPIIPFRIEDVPPARALEYYISSPHWLDALTPPLEEHLKQLASTIQILLDRASSQTSQAPVGRREERPVSRVSQPAAVPARANPEFWRDTVRFDRGRSAERFSSSSQQRPWNGWGGAASGEAKIPGGSDHRHRGPGLFIDRVCLFRVSGSLYRQPRPKREHVALKVPSQPPCRRHPAPNQLRPRTS